MTANGRQRPTRLAMEVLEQRVLLSTAVALAAPPTVVTGAAVSVSATGATLRAAVNPQGATTTVRFQYSTDPSFLPSVVTTVGSGFNNPIGVAVDTAGDVFVANDGNGAVNEILPSGTIKTIGRANGPGIAIDAAGDVFVADTTTVKEFLPNGKVKALGTGIRYATSVAVDKAGNIFVIDSFTDAVKEILPNGVTKTLLSGHPLESLALDVAGDVFVVGPGVLTKIMPDGTKKTFPLNDPDIGEIGLAIDPSGNILASDGHSSIKQIFPDGHTEVVLSGFDRPEGLATDSTGDLFVADYYNNRVVKLSVPTIAATPSPLTGTIAKAVSAALSGLNDDALYFYRAVASNTGGISNGLPGSFRTLASPPRGGINGIVFNDANGNGKFDANESGLPGRDVYLDDNNNGKFDPGELFVTTGSAPALAGYYSFPGLVPGAYKVRQILPAGWQQVAPANNFGQTIILAPGQEVGSKNFADRATGSITGSVFNDTNGNGVVNAGETGLAGRTIYLDANNNGKFDPGEITTTTSASGAYTFAGLSAGSYKVRQVLPSGWQQVAPTNNFGQTVTLAAGQNVTSKNFADRKAVVGSMSGVIVSAIIGSND